MSDRDAQTLAPFPSLYGGFTRFDKHTSQAPMPRYMPDLAAAQPSRRMPTRLLARPVSIPRPKRARVVDDAPHAKRRAKTSPDTDADANANAAPSKSTRAPETPAGAQTRSRAQNARLQSKTFERREPSRLDASQHTAAPASKSRRARRLRRALPQTAQRVSSDEDFM